MMCDDESRVSAGDLQDSTAQHNFDSIGFKQSTPNLLVLHSTLPAFGLSSYVLTPFEIGPKIWGLTGILGYQYRKISNNWPMCYVVGVASSGMVWHGLVFFFFFFMSLRGAEQLLFRCDFCPFSE